MSSDESQNEVMKQDKQLPQHRSNTTVEEEEQLNREIIETYVSVNIVCPCFQIMNHAFEQCSRSFGI